MVYFGDSGIGKTATAHALARDLGVDVEEGGLGGFHEISSGEQRADTVREVLGHLHYRPMFGSGWKMLCVNEADNCRPEAEVIWLDALERLPERTLVVFTTNDISKISRRLRERCELFGFSCDTDDLAPHIRAYCEKVWKAEGCDGPIPDIDRLGMPTLGECDSMHCSFRLALTQLGKFIREWKFGDRDKMADVKTQLASDCLAFSTADAECPHCRAKLKVKTGAKTVKCRKCGRKSELLIA